MLSDLWIPQNMAHFEAEWKCSEPKDNSADYEEIQSAQ